MNSYSIDSDSPRWWWPQAAAGAAATVAIAAILAVPTAGVALPGGSNRDVASDPATWVTTSGPQSDHQCFMTRLPWNAALDNPPPRCGRLPGSEGHQWTGVLRPGLSSMP